jgi:hypothetical protein
MRQKEWIAAEGTAPLAWKADCLILIGGIQQADPTCLLDERKAGLIQPVSVSFIGAPKPLE